MQRLILMLSLLLLASAAVAGPALDAYNRFTDGLHTLRAHFEQTVLNTQKGTEGKISGTFEVKRPGLFRWDYGAPDNRKIIADGTNLWVVDPNLDHITQLPEERSLKGTPAQLLLDKQPLDQAFKVSELGEHRGMQWLQLVPRTKDSDIVRLLLGFKGDQLLRLETEDNFGHVTRFSFSDIQRNLKLPDSVFHYTPPQGWYPLDVST